MVAQVSIHAPARGATIPTSPQHVSHLSFNPRPRAGGDHEELQNYVWKEVSIHAPARGAT